MKCKNPDCETMMSEGAPDYCPTCQQVRNENEAIQWLSENADDQPDWVRSALAARCAERSFATPNVEAPVCWICDQKMERREGKCICVSCDADYRRLKKELATEADALEQMTMAANQLHAELAEAIKERDENAFGWRNVRECLERVAAERDAVKAELERRTREVIGEEFMAKDMDLQKQFSEVSAMNLSWAAKSASQSVEIEEMRKELADEKEHRAALERTLDAMNEADLSGEQ